MNDVAVDAKRILLRYGAPIEVLDAVSEVERIELARLIAKTSLPDREKDLRQTLADRGYMEAAPLKPRRSRRLIPSPPPAERPFGPPGKILKKKAKEKEKAAAKKARPQDEAAPAAAKSVAKPAKPAAAAGRAKTRSAAAPAPRKRPAASGKKSAAAPARTSKPAAKGKSAAAKGARSRTATKPKARGSK